MNIPVLFSVSILILYCNTAIAGTLNKCISTCYSKDCSEKAKTLLANMDQAINPCDDFYQFVCGNYIKQQVIAKDRVSANQFYSAQDRLDKKLLNEVKREVLPTDNQSIKKLKIHYKNCLDEAEIEKLGATPLLDLLKRLGGWPVLLGDKWDEGNFKWEDLMATISREGFRPGLPINVFIYYDSTNSHKHSLNIVPTGTMVTEASDDKFIEAYKSYLVEIAVLLGANRDRAKVEMNDLVEFDQKLFLSQLPKKELEDVSPIENRKTISALIKEYPDIPWLDVINGILSPSNVTVTENEYVEIQDPKFMCKIGSLIKNTPKRVLANYQIKKVIEPLVTFLSDKFLKVELNFLQKIIGLKEFPKREQLCFIRASNTFDIAISSLYVRKHFDQQSKFEAVELINNIRETTKASLEKIVWMDDNTRKGALKKLAAMKTLAGYSDELFDDRKIDSFYDNIEITPGKYFDDIQKIIAYKKNFNVQKLRKPVEQYDWINDADVTAVNAYYNTAKNQISIIAGILQDPFFNSQCPDYVNYGGVGWVIGHEITHGFDYTGRKYDYDGNIKDWWNNQTAEQFERKVQCIVDEYDNFTVKQIDKKINGKLTKSENIADAGGVKLAYHAYGEVIKNRGIVDPCLPDLNYTPEQMFWISAATTWCQKVTDEALKINIAEDFHSPNEARVNVVFSNNEEFAKDFKCPAGSAMNPAKKCEVW